MSLGLWPEAVPFDPNSGTASHDLRKHFDAARMPPASLLVCARDMRGAEWPGRAAIGLARALAAGDRPVVLLDLDFERPTLHELLDAANMEGVADAILFGASLERVTIEPAGEMFGFVPPGAVAPDPAELMADASWSRLLAELNTSDSLLLAYAPLGAPGIDALAERITSVVVLAEEIDVAGTAAMLPETIRVDGVIRPAGEVAVTAPTEPEPPAAAPSQEADEPEPVGPAAIEPVAAQPAAPVTGKEEARQALKAELEARQRAAAEAGETPAPRPAAPAKKPAPTKKKPIEWRRVARWAALIIVIAAAGTWVGQMMAGGGGESAPPGGPDGAPVATAAGDLLGFSVAIESYEDYDAAMSRADSLALAAPDLTFFVAPVRDVDDAVIYRVLAGPMTDSAGASAVMQRLVQEGLKIAPSEYDVRETPLAFLVGEYEFRGDAEARMTELRARAVPTYIIEVPYRQGPTRYWVYAGAYSRDTDARLMRERLIEAGVQDTLVLRVGRIQP